MIDFFMKVVIVQLTTENDQSDKNQLKLKT